MFCDTALAARIEAAETDLITTLTGAALRRSGGSGFVMSVAGGAATFAGDGSPYTKVVGLGFGGVPTEAELREVEGTYAEHGAPVQVELAHLADPRLAALLTARGYQLTGYEDVLGLDLRTASDLATPGIEVRVSPDEEFERWLDVVVEATLHEDEQGLPWTDQFGRQALEDAERDSAAAGLTRYSAYRDGVLAGGAEFRISDGIAQFAGAATALEHRRRGVQTALLAARLADARAAGCDVAVIVTQPGSRSQQNAQRRGFRLLYTRATLVKQPRNPVPAVVIAPYTGDRARLRPLFELAEDSAAQLDAYLGEGDVFVARVGDEPVGHLQVVDTGQPGELEVKNMAVAEALQGNGIGSHLVQAAIAHARSRAAHRLLVTTAAADVGNLRFYQRAGFRMLDVERDAFGPTTGYPQPITIDGIPLRDRVRLDLDLRSHPRAAVTAGQQPRPLLSRVDNIRGAGAH